MKKERKIVYYDDELNDEFSSAKITPIKINGKYRYLRDNIFEKALSFFLYRVVATPLSKLFLKIKYKHKIVGREKIKKYKGAYFLYGNHTSAAADPFIPSMVAFPKGVYVIVHPANVSMPVLGVINRYIGALPLPNDLKANKNFLRAIEKRVGENKAICIYPEAHIWPYYTGIRPFTDRSFHYPVKYKTAAFVFTDVYKKRGKRGDKFTPQIITYVDGPFFPDETLPAAEARKKLRDEAYSAMLERSKLSDYDMIVYLKRPDDAQCEKAATPPR